MSLRIFDIVIGKQSQKYVPVKPQPQPEPQKEVQYTEFIDKINDYILDGSLIFGNFRMIGYEYPPDEQNPQTQLFQKLNSRQDVTKIIYTKQFTTNTIPPLFTRCLYITEIQIGFDLIGLLRNSKDGIQYGDLLTGCRDLEIVKFTVPQTMMRNMFGITKKKFTVNILKNNQWMLVKPQQNSGEIYYYLVYNKSQQGIYSQYNQYNRIEQGTDNDDGTLTLTYNDVDDVQYIINQYSLQQHIQNYYQYINIQDSLRVLHLNNMIIENSSGGSLILPDIVNNIYINKFQRYYGKDDDEIGAQSLFQQNNNIQSISIEFKQGQDINCINMCMGCNNLVNIELKSNDSDAQLLCMNMCNGCQMLRTVTFVGKLTEDSIDSSTLNGCEHLWRIYFPNYWNVITATNPFPTPNSPQQICAIYLGGTNTDGESYWSEQQQFDQGQLYIYKKGTWSAGILPSIIARLGNRIDMEGHFVETTQN